MKILGIRTSTNSVRYAILDNSTGAVVFSNPVDNRLIYPRDMTTIESKIVWLSEQFRRILDINPDINKIIIKAPELGRNDGNASRASDYLDAVIILEATKRTIPIPLEMKMYRAINTRSRDVLAYAETNICRTARYWDASMADAIAAAFSEFGGNS